MSFGGKCVVSPCGSCFQLKETDAICAADNERWMCIICHFMWPLSYLFQWWLNQQRLSAGQSACRQQRVLRVLVPALR